MHCWVTSYAVANAPLTGAGNWAFVIRPGGLTMSMAL